MPVTGFKKAYLIQVIAWALLFDLFFQVELPYFSAQYFSSQSAYAADASPAPSDIGTGDYDKICKDVMSSSSSGTTPTNINTQKLEYCKAAKSAMEASDANSAMWKVWAGVAGVCAAACGASFMGVGNQFICAGVSAAGGIADAVVTKNFMSALTGIAAAGGSLMVNQMTRPAAQTGPNAGPAPKARDYGACMAAAVAAFQVYSKYTSMQSNTKTAETNLASASTLDDGLATSGVSNTLIAASADATGGNTSGTLSGSTAATLPSSGNSTPSAQDTCSAARSSATIGLTIQCAVASDSTIPNFVTQSRFPTDFKNASGIDLGNFFSKNESPSKSLVAAMGGNLNSDQLSKLGAAVRDMEQKVYQDNTFLAYTSSGGGSRGGGSDPSMNDMISGIMQQFMPPQQSQENNQTTGLSTVIFANQTQSPAAVAENRSLNIFDRISYRYYFVGQKFLQESN